MPDRRAKVVIVGGGFGGIEAAKSLASIKIAISGRLRSSRVKFGTGFVVE
jgi:NADH dehydrogenase FAD-containing subunit